MVRGSKPLKRQADSTLGTMRGAIPATARTMARMCSGVVPQQPPTMFTNPLAANSLKISAVSPAVSSYSPKALGSPALG